MGQCNNCTLTTGNLQQLHVRTTHLLRIHTLALHAIAHSNPNAVWALTPLTNTLTSRHHPTMKIQ